MSCPHCQHDAKFEGYRAIQKLRTVVGEVHYERAYYYCPHCHTGHYQDDVELRLLGQQTAGFQEIVSMCGITDAFATVAGKTLYKVAGLICSTSMAERTTEVSGDVASQYSKAGKTFQATTVAPWELPVDAEGHTVICMSCDMTSVPQQGPHGESAEGRMPCVGAIFTEQMHDPQSTRQKLSRRARKLHQVHYIAGLMSLPELSQKLRAQAIAVGLERANVVVCLTDGGNGFRECLLAAVQGLSQETVFVLDIHHVYDHLVEFAKLYISDPETRQSTVDSWKTLLKQQGGAKLFTLIENLDLTNRSAVVIEGHRQVTQYLRNNVDRMDYPTYLARGWPIGSGVIESACKTIVGKRMKQGGMRWHEPQTNGISHLRALFLSGDDLWDEFWSKITLPPRLRKPESDLPPTTSAHLTTTPHLQN